MTKEIERRFLIDSELFRSDYRYLGADEYLINQFYLSVDPERCVRVRRTDDIGHMFASKSFLTIKGKKVGASATEIEVELPYGSYSELLPMRVAEEVKKVRYVCGTENINLRWEVDMFLGANDGLWIAEIELPSEDTKIILPPWIKEEITSDWRYSNMNLALIPFSTWNEKVNHI